jgi:Excreted virulence factor EspC, type VII ESX diderm
MTGILKVIPSWLQILSGRQNATTGDIKGAISSATGVSQAVMNTHGTHTSNFSSALQQYETTRASAGTGLEGVASGLANALAAAAKQYLNIDLFGKGLLDGQVNL